MTQIRREIVQREIVIRLAGERATELWVRRVWERFWPEWRQPKLAEIVERHQ